MFVFLVRISLEIVDFMKRQEEQSLDDSRSIASRSRWSFELMVGDGCAAGCWVAVCLTFFDVGQYVRHLFQT